METKQQRKDEAWKKYLEVRDPAWKKYLEECKKIDNEPEVEQIIEHNGHKYKLIEDKT